jgi:hypothetical protein
MDNAAPLYSRWEDDLLKIELRAIEGAGLALSTTGIADDALKRLLAVGGADNVVKASSAQASGAGVKDVGEAKITFQAAMSAPNYDLVMRAIYKAKEAGAEDHADALVAIARDYLGESA